MKNNQVVFYKEKAHNLFQQIKKETRRGYSYVNELTPLEDKVYVEFASGVTFESISKRFDLSPKEVYELLKNASSKLLKAFEEKKYPDFNEEGVKELGIALTLDAYEELRDLIMAKKSLKATLERQGEKKEVIDSVIKMIDNDKKEVMRGLKSTQMDFITMGYSKFLYDKIKNKKVHFNISKSKPLSSEEQILALKNRIITKYHFYGKHKNKQEPLNNKERKTYDKFCVYETRYPSRLLVVFDTKEEAIEFKNTISKENPRLTYKIKTKRYYKQKQK